MAKAGVILANNVSSTGPQDWKFFKGGRASLIVSASSFSTTCNFELMSASGGAIVLNAANIQTDGATSYDLPEGQFRMNLSGGSPSAVTACLESVPYT